MERRQLQRVRVELLILLFVVAVWLATALVALDTAQALTNALEQHKAAVAADPNDPSVNFALAEAYHRRGHLEAAVQSYENTIRLAPDRLYVYDRLADCYHALDRPDDVAAVWRRGFERDADWAWQRFDLVRNRLATANDERRVEWWKQVAELRSDMGWPYVFLAEAYEKLQQNDESRVCYAQASQVDPDLADWLMKEADERSEQRRWGDAVRFYERSLNVRPDFPEARFALGRAYLEMDMREPALNEYRALKNAGEEPAAELLELIRSRYRHCLELHLELGRIHIALEAYEDAVADYDEALALDSKHAAAHIGLGEALHALGRYNDAVRAYRKGILLAPGAARGHLLLGKTYVAQEYYGMALDSLQRAVETDPEAPEMCHELGQFYLRIDNQAMAVKQYRRLKALDSELADDLRRQIQYVAERPARLKAAEARLQSFGRLKTIGFDQSGNCLAYFERLDEPVRHGDVVFGLEAEVLGSEVRFSTEGTTWVRELSP